MTRTDHHILRLFTAAAAKSCPAGVDVEAAARDVREMHDALRLARDWIAEWSSVALGEETGIRPTREDALEQLAEIDELMERTRVP